MFRTIAIAATAATAIGGAAVAQDMMEHSYIAYQGDKFESSSVVALDTVLAARDGVIEIYDYNTGEMGDLLGSQEVSAGANSDVRIDVTPDLTEDAIAVLKIDGVVYDTLKLDVEM